MKKLSLFLCGVLVGALMFGSVAIAASSSIGVDFVPLKYFFDGVQKYPSGNQQGFIYNGSTYVPLRFMAESLGCDVQWDGQEKSITVISNGSSSSSSDSSSSDDTSPQDSDTGEKYLTDTLEPYAKEGGIGTANYYIKVNDPVTLGDNTYYKSIYTDCSSYMTWRITYDLKGEYDILKFKVMCHQSSNKFKVIVDDEIVWAEPITANDLPEEVEIDVSDANKLQFEGYGNWCVIDPTIE